MKKLIISTLAITAFVAASYGQGTISFDGTYNTNPSISASSEGMIFLNGVLDTGTDLNFTLLGGASADSLSPVVSLLLSATTTTQNSALGGIQPASGDITAFGTGQVYDNSGVAYVFSNIAPGTAAYFQVEAWSGNFSTYAAALAGGAATGVSTVFTEVLASASGSANDIEGMSAINVAITPEPTTIALAGFGIAGLVAFRRKK